MFHCYKIKWKIIAALGALLLVCCLSVPAITTATADCAVPEEEYVKVPIVMYHSVLKDKKMDGKYVVSPTEFENDLIYLEEHGYTTIFLQELVDYVYTGAALPEKPVVITFDDGYLNNLTYVLPILQKRRSTLWAAIPNGFPIIPIPNPITPT